MSPDQTEISPIRISAAALLALSTLGLLAHRPVLAAPKPDGPDRQLHQQLVQKGVNYLRTRGQAADGSYSAGSGPGVTALVTTAVLRSGYSVDDPLVAKSLSYLQGFVRPDGGVYADGSHYRNYETCLTLMCLVEAAKQRPAKYEATLRAAERFVKGLQNDEGEGHDRSSTSFGGTGYGSHKRPDLSNTGIFIDALVAAGNGPDDEAIRKALVFVSRCQNLETEHNDTKWSAKNPDGGFYYTAAAGGSSQAKWEVGESEEVRGLRSYGSMTYMGLKSMIYAGVDRDDPRVKTATKWLRKNYRLDQNPGLGKQGLFYFYHTFAKALSAIGEDTFVDERGVRHDWRRELIETLAAEQQEDGSWINTHERWLEADPNLVTGYALLALSYCRPENKDR